MNPLPAGVKGTAAPLRIPYQFRALPCETTSSRAISQSAKILHAVLLDAGRRKGACTLTNRTLGGMIGRSPATVKRLLAELEAAGLARRELSAGGRIRSGVVPIAPDSRVGEITKSGVAHSQATERIGVAQSRSEGGSSSAPGVAHSRSASIQSSSQNESPDGVSQQLVGNNRPVSGTAAADYLKACVAAARAGRPMPEFPDLGKTQPTGGCTVPPPSPKGIPIQDTPAPTPMAPPDAFMPSVGRMVASLGERLKAESVGRRRVGPKRLAAQLAEVRRRHGRRE